MFHGKLFDYPWVEEEYGPPEITIRSPYKPLLEIYDESIEMGDLEEGDIDSEDEADVGMSSYSDGEEDNDMDEGDVEMEELGYDSESEEADS